MSDPLVVARTLHFASIATFAGLFLLLFFVGEPVLRTSACTLASLRKRFAALGWVSLVVAVPFAPIGPARTFGIRLHSSNAF